MTPIAAATWRRAHWSRIYKKRPREAIDAGEDVSLISYLPTTFTTLFVLAAGLLLGFIR